MANSITSLRAIARLDWETFVEEQSAIEAELRRGPGRGLHPDDLRHARPVPARGGADRQADGAGGARGGGGGRAIEPGGRPGRARHVGYYLVDEGLAQLEALTGYRPDGPG